MSNWDEEEDDTPVAPLAPKQVIIKKKFADEDVSDEEAKDDWDVSEDEEAEAKKKAAALKPVAVVGSLRAKGSTKAKIAEKEEQERLKAEAFSRRGDGDVNSRKLAERDAILKSDMDNAAALFGSASLNDYVNPFDVTCKTQEEYMTLSSTISALLIKKHGNNPNYAAFVKQFVKDVCEPLKDVDVRLASSGLGTLANIKQQEQRDAAGGKKKKTGKPLLGANKTVGRADTGTYDEILDDSGDYDDFM